MNEGMTRNDISVGEISWRNVPGQEFVPAQDDLCGIDLLMATFARRNTCRVCLRLVQFCDGAKDEIRVSEADASDLSDNSWQSFRFDAIRGSKGRTFYFYVESPDAQPGSAVTLWANSQESPPGCQLHVNHGPVPGSLCFKPVYASPPLAGFRDEWEEYGKWDKTAFRMMDGSRDEEDLRQRGAAVAGILESALAINRSHRVLEIGCGVGRVAREMADRAGALVCVDISSRMLDFARGRLAGKKNVEFISLSEKTLAELPGGTFDRVYSHIVFFHLPREQIFDYLKETARLLKPDGVAYFDTWNLCHPSGFDRWLEEVERYRGRDKPNAYNRFHTRSEIECLMARAGLQGLLIVEGPLLCSIASRIGAEALDGGPAAESLRKTAEMLLAMGEAYVRKEEGEGN